MTHLLLANTGVWPPVTEVCELSPPGEGYLFLGGGTLGISKRLNWRLFVTQFPCPAVTLLTYADCSARWASGFYMTERIYYKYFQRVINFCPVARDGQ